MQDLNHLPGEIAWLAFALALVFGAVANRANFCTMGAITDAVHVGDWRRMRMWLLAIAVALIPLGTAFTFPCVTSMLSRVISSRERGLYMGVQQTFGGLSRVIIPLWAGFSYDHLGKTVPLFTSAALVFGTIVLGFGIDDGRKAAVPVASP